MGYAVGRRPPAHVINGETLFRSQGMKNPLPRIRMIDGFSEGWIDFESGETNSRKERTPLEAVLRSLVASSPNS
jgi:NAD(P)H dehydrogenase (quinone)